MLYERGFEKSCNFRPLSHCISDTVQDGTNVALIANRKLHMRFQLMLKVNDLI